jgi:hypothetical protein
MIACILACHSLAQTPSAVGTQLSSFSGNVTLSPSTTTTVGSMTVSSAGGLFDFDASTLIGASAGARVTGQLVIDGTPTGVQSVFDSSAGGLLTLNVPVQTQLSAGTHTVALEVSDYIAPANDYSFSNFTNILATAYQTIDGQASAVGAQLSSFNGSVSLNPPPANYTTVGSMTVVSTGDSYDINTSTVIGTSSGTKVSGKVLIDGTPIPNGNTATFSTNSGGYITLNLPVQAQLAAGTHTISLAVSDASASAFDFSELGSTNIIATAHQVVDGQATASESTFGLGTGDAAAGSVTDLGTSPIISNGGLYDLSATIEATPDVNGSDPRVYAQFLIDGVPTGVESAFDLYANNTETLTVPAQVELSPGSHTIALQLTDMYASASYSDQLSLTQFNNIQPVPEPSTWVIFTVSIAGLILHRGRRLIGQIRKIKHSPRFSLAIVILFFSFQGAIICRADILYVSNADGTSPTIEKFTSNGVGSAFASSGLDRPAGLAFDGAGDLYVGNNDSTIEEFTLGGGGSVFSNGSNGSNIPTGLAFDGSGNLYSANWGNGTIEKYTSSGIGSVFASTGLSEPNGIAFDIAGNLYAANTLNNTIEKFTSAGVGSVFATSASGLDQPIGLAINSAGDLFVANYIGNNIEEFTPGGVESVFATGLNGPEGIAFDSAGNLYVANIDSGNIEEITPSGTESVFASGLSSPTFLAFTNDAGQPLALPSTAPVPEPSTWAIVAAGIGILIGFRRRRRPEDALCFTTKRKPVVERALLLPALSTALFLAILTPSRSQVVYSTLASNGTYNDSSYLAICGASSGVGVYESAAYPFVPSISGDLSSIDLGVYNLSTNNVDGNFVLNLDANNPSGGPLTTDVLTSAYLTSPSEESDSLLTTFTYEGPSLNLVQGTTYWLVLSPLDSTSDVGWGGAVPFSTTTAYFSHNSGVSYSSASEGEVAFRINDAAAVPEPSVWAILATGFLGMLAFRKKGRRSH